jgi:hypothetical protein
VLGSGVVGAMAQALDKAWDAAVAQLIDEALALDHKERARGLS